MNLTLPNRWSERQQVLAILLGMAVILTSLCFLLLLPVMRHRQQLEGDIASKTAELMQKNYFEGEDALQRRLDSEQRRYVALTNDWQTTVLRLGALAGDESVSPGEVAHIDFKVALFSVRQRLIDKSRKLGAKLPHDLGVDETVESNEDAYQRMLQLRVVEKLVDLSLDLKIKTVREIQPLPPIIHRAAAKTEVFFIEYPLELDLYGTLDNLYALLGVVTDPEHVFVLRGLRVEPASAGGADLLNIKAVMSALVFMKHPSEITGTAAVASRPAVRRAALGH